MKLIEVVALTRCKPAGLRSSARLAGQSASELNDRHRQLLHKLLHKLLNRRLMLQ